MKNNILVAALILVAIALGYVWYSYIINQPPSPVEQASKTTELAEAQELIELLTTLQSVDIDTAFFDDSLYESLLDLAPAIVKPDAIGRPNPFLPI